MKDLYEAHLAGAEDQQVIDFAITEGRILVTLDLDFGEVFYLSRRGRFGVIVLRVRPATVEKITETIVAFLKKIDLEKEKLSRSLIVLNEKRFRVVR